HHIVHRRTSAPAQSTTPGGPWHPAADLPRGCDGEQAVRSPAATARTRRTTARGPCRRTPRGNEAAVETTRSSGFRAMAAGLLDARIDRHHLPRRAPVVVGDAGAHTGPAAGGPRRRAHHAGAVVAG